MQMLRRMTVIVGAFAIAACDVGPTGPANMQAEFDAIDPVVATFSATQGLPGGPFGVAGGPPFMGGMAFTGAPMGGPHGAGGPGAALPPELKLSDAQKAAIQTLVTAFEAANAADIATMKAAHTAARDAHKAGKSRAEVKAILDAAKPAATRLRAAAETLRAAIGNVLTAAQKAWLEAHKPERPPRTP